MSVTPLPADALYRQCDLSRFEFETTAELEQLSGVVGQTRAQQAIQFGIGIQREGYNLYAMGPSGIGKHGIVRRYLEDRAGGQKTPDDWCYVNNFDQSHRPRALGLPAGTGRQFQRDMERLIEELASAIPAAFESDEYRSAVLKIEEEFKQHQDLAFENLESEAAEHGIKLFRTPSGFAFAPVRRGEVVGPKEFEALPERERHSIEAEVARLQEQLQAIVKQMPQWGRESRQKIKQLDRSVARTAVAQPLEELQRKYAALEPVLTYLKAVKQDLIKNVNDFRKGEDGETQTTPRELHRYKVNVLVDNSETTGAPVVYLDHPTYQDLTGRAEHLAQFGTLVTDFTLLKPGALHRANGGYLMLDAHKVLSHPFAWEGLKRTLYGNEVRIESIDRMMNLASTVSLEPDAIPLDIKVVLLGDRMLYALLSEYDTDFDELFKVPADFETELPRNDENVLTFARFIATLGQKEGLLPFHRAAVGRVVEFASRYVEDTEKLSTHMRSIADLLRESDYWAAQAGHAAVQLEDVQQAIDHQHYRNARPREQLREAILRGSILIDTDGIACGQINGLSVVNFGTGSFGQPSRITATVHIGEGHVVDIEREVELGGAIHSKGVMILSSFLAARFARNQPLSLSASLVFEQSYGGVEGDSASLAELCALLSALAEVPIRQNLSVTGSVNQFGRVQVIGGVNEKIEGFFELCQARGQLDGQHGVLIPKENVQHLMLHPEVVQAARDGRFHIYPIETVDQAIELLTGVPAGSPDTNGVYPAASVNGRAMARLLEMATIRHSFGDRDKDREDHHD